MSTQINHLRIHPSRSNLPSGSAQWLCPVDLGLDGRWLRWGRANP